MHHLNRYYQKYRTIITEARIRLKFCAKPG